MCYKLHILFYTCTYYTGISIDIWLCYTTSPRAKPRARCNCLQVSQALSLSINVFPKKVFTFAHPFSTVDILFFFFVLFYSYFFSTFFFFIPCLL